STTAAGSGTAGGGGGGVGGGGGGFWQGLAGVGTQPLLTGTPGPPPIGSGIKPPGGTPPTGPPTSPLRGDDGPVGSTGSRLNRLESKVDGSDSMPLATASGRSSSAMVGSSSEVSACGKTET